TSHLKATPSQPGRWHPVGLAQMEQWVALNKEQIRDQLKLIASKVTHGKRFLRSDIEDND
ncbi:transducin/WD40 repeat protein, partial [Trifolium medium]|nr:transducin/WD40 repeat protein [Trifolium medium]